MSNNLLTTVCGCNGNVIFKVIKQSHEHVELTGSASKIITNIYTADQKINTFCIIKKKLQNDLNN